MTGTSPSDRFTGSLNDCENIGAIDTQARHAIAQGLQRQRVVLHTQIFGLAGATADQYHRGAVHGSEVHSDMKSADRRGALAKKRHDHVVLARELGGMGHAGGLGQMGPHRGAYRHHAPSSRTVMCWHLSAQQGIALVAQELIDIVLETVFAPKPRSLFAQTGEYPIRIAQGIDRQMARFFAS